MTDESPIDPEQRLAQLRTDRLEEEARSPNTLGRIAIPLLLSCALLIWFLPKLMAPVGESDRMLERSLTYCKYSENKAECESKLRDRHEVCTANAARSDAGTDIYGSCMDASFPHFYKTLAETLPKQTLSP